MQGLGDANVDAFAIFVEELDHFLVIAERARHARPVSLLELELHAGVTKYLLCALFLSRRADVQGEPGGPRRTDRRLADEDRLWLRWHLFGSSSTRKPIRPSGPLSGRRALARRFIDRLEAEPSSPRSASSGTARLPRPSHQQKLEALSLAELFTTDLLRPRIWITRA
jgi:hypothetical protein